MTPTQGERSRKWRATPRGQYSVHKHNAKVRGVEFKLTFEQWWGIWQRSGHWGERGNTAGHYVMCRKGDEGAYAVGNVFIAKFERNAKDSCQKLNAMRRISGVRKRHTARSTTVIFRDDGHHNVDPW